MADKPDAMALALRAAIREEIDAALATLEIDLRKGLEPADAVKTTRRWLRLRAANARRGETS